MDFEIGIHHNNINSVLQSMRPDEAGRQYSLVIKLLHRAPRPVANSHHDDGQRELAE